MSKLLKNSFLFFLLTFFLPTTVLSGELTPAFPGAEGFGRYTSGGRGGDVYHVTSLADDGSSGTLRWAINQSGKRTVVFDVSGTIHLISALSIRNANITIAGQTAPGDGICVADYPFTINASNVIIRFMRFRLGNKYVAYHEGDGLGGMDQQNIMIDHCSVSWSIDECLSVYGMKNATIQWCIASQSLRNSGHSKGAHGYGGNWGGAGASYHHNLICHNESRTPRLGPRASTQTDERMDMRNNVIYNWGGNGCYGGEGMNVNIVNNYYKPGPGTIQKGGAVQYRIAAVNIRTTSYVASNPSFAPMLHVWGKYFVDGNYINGYSDVTADNWTKGMYEQISNASNDNLYTETTKDTIKLNAPINFFYTTTHTAQTAYQRVLDYAGASLSRDWVDTLMVYDTRNGIASHTGLLHANIPGIIDSQDDNKPDNAGDDWNAWPVLVSATPPVDTDRDGIPDLWESNHGLNPNDYSDKNTLNQAGYTMLEVYMNSLVADIMTAGNAGGVALGKTTEENNGVTSQVYLHQSTYTGIAGAASPWSFDGGYTITNSNAKTYSTGSELGVKYSAGTQYTVTLPLDIAVDSLVFSGYDNYADADSYLAELNGTAYGADKYVFVKKKETGDYTLCKHTVTINPSAKNLLTFTFQGKQVALSIVLWVRTVITENKSTIILTDNDTLVNVYTIEGRLIRSGIPRRSATESLPHGVYVIDNKKVLIIRK
ncbi:MAG: hypothetical protein H6Q20_1646 [Bacteroidetes bacterium]|nr:hypothetical protein [Bacteroidota bacterium]